MSTIVQSYDASNNAVYPVTHLRAVRDSSGTTLESMMQDVREMSVGYYECSTPGSTAAKTITTDSSVSLSTKILCKVKFVEKNTANNATMNINGTGAKALYYNGVRAAANNSWYPNEVVDLYYDGTNYQAKSCADTLEYDVSLHQTHEITEITKTTRTLVFNGNVVSSWESETSISDSSVEGYTRSETNTGQDVDSTTVDGPNATYNSSANQTNVVYVTTHTYTHVVNNYTFQEAVNAVPMSYRHGGLKLRFISNSGSGQSSDNKYVQYRLMKNIWSTTVIDWQGVDDEPIARSNNLVKSGGVYNLNKKLDTIKGVDNTDLTQGYYYDNTNGNKVANSTSFSTLIDIPAETKEITFNLENSSTVAFYGIALYDAAVSELTDENISSHFIKGFNEKALNEVPRIVIDSSYKSIAISSIPIRNIHVIFNPKISSVKYGSRLIDVFYLNDSSARSLKGKSLFLKTLNKSTGIISFRDSNSKDYNIFSTKKSGKELLICKDSNYVYLGVLVDWDIVDYDFTDIPQSEENTIVLSTPKSSEGQRIFDMFFNKKYRQIGNTIKNGDGVISEYDCVWEDGTAGHVTYNTFDDNVLEYRSSIVTYGSNYAVHYGLKTFDEFGNVISETGLEIRIV